MEKRKLPLLSIVIPAFNSKNHYKALLGSLLNIKYPHYEIIVVDDGSTDGSYEEIKRVSEKNKNLRIIRTLSRKGIPDSRNLGIEVSGGELIAFFDMDMEVNKSWPGELINLLLHNNKIGAVLPKVLDFNDRNKIQAVGFKIDPHTVWVVPKGYGELDKGQYKDVEKIAIGAAGSIIKREVIEKVGGFDKYLGMFDDIDLGWRIRIAGWETLCVPSVFIYHWTTKPWSIRPKSSSLLEQDFYINNLMRSVLKNFEMRNIIRYLPQRTLIMIFRVFYNLLNGNTIAFQGFTKALFWNIFNLKDTLSERRKINDYRKVHDLELFKEIFVDGSFVEIYNRELVPLSKKVRSWSRSNYSHKKLKK